MKKIVKFIVLGLVVAVVAVGVYYYVTAPLVVPLTTVTARTVELAITEQGVVSRESVVMIYPLAQGPLLEIHVVEGQAVNAGDVLCEIDSEALFLRMDELNAVIRGYEAQIRSARAQVRNTNAVTDERLILQNTLIEQNERDVERAQENLERLEVLFDLGIIPMSDVEEARGLVEVRQSAVTASRQELSLIEAGRGGVDVAGYYQALIDSTRATIALLEREALNYTVRSSAYGVISRLPVKGTNIVSMATPVAEITVPEDIVIEVFVSTQDLDNVRDLVLSRRDGDIRFSGHVSQVGSAAEIRLSALGVEERRVKVQIVPDMTTGVDEAELGDGFDVDVRFILYREENKLAVPRSALFKDGGRDMLWVVRDGVAHVVEVTLGMELRTETVVDAGLFGGDLVVTDANNASLRNGVVVLLEARG
jgi:HlyD family secretion protein